MVDLPKHGLRATRERWIHIAAGLFAATLPLLFHARFFSGESILYRSDNAHQQHARFEILCDALQHERSWPLWQNLIYGGSPFHANPEVPTLYLPILVLASVLDPIWTLNLTVLIHFAVAGLGMYLFASRLGSHLDGGRALAPAAGLVAATVFSLGFFTRGDLLMNLVVYGAAHALIPWIFLAAEGVLTGSRPRRAAGALALLVAGQIFTGGLYVFAYTWVGLLMWFVGRALVGGAPERRRILRYGLIAGALAFVMALAKLLPYLEWIPETNRGEGLTFEESLGVTLGGHGAFDWATVWKRLAWSTGGGWAALPAVFALPLLRLGTVRVSFVIVLVSFVVALGGPVWRFLHDYVFPFSEIRGATRGWVLGNAFLPVLSGFGTAWLMGRSAWLRATWWRAPLAGCLVALLLAPRLNYSYRHESSIRQPESFSELLTRYPRWNEVAERNATGARAVYLDRDRPDLRTEQFITSALGIETVGGSIGYVWPSRLLQHLYGPEEARVDRKTRRRRLATQSVRWLVVDDPAVPPEGDPADLCPVGIDGTAVEENRLARPRAFVPAAVVAVVADPRRELLYALLDLDELAIDRVSLVSIDGGTGLAPEQLAALDAVLVAEAGGAAPPWAASFAESATDAGLDVRRVPLPLEGPARASLAAWASSLADDAAEVPGALGFERRGPHETFVGPDEASSGRFVVVSEPWSWYPGWRVTSAERELLVLDADGLSSAVYLGPRERALTARYAPRSVTWGLLACAAGALAALGMVCRPETTDGRRRPASGAGTGRPLDVRA